MRPMFGITGLMFKPGPLIFQQFLMVRKFIKAKIIVQDSLSDNYQMVTGHVRTEEVLKFHILKASYLYTRSIAVL